MMSANEAIAPVLMKRANDTPAPQPPDAPPEVAGYRAVIAPPTRLPRIDFAELWKFRELLFYLVWRDVKVRYKQTVLGVAWAVLQPAMMMVVFTVFFHRVAGMDTGGWPASLFYLTGLLPWYFFQQAVNSSGASVVGSEHLITKIYFPRLIIPIASVLAAVFDAMIALSLLAVVWIYLLAFDGDFQRLPSVQILYLPLVYLGIAVLAAGIGTLIAALNVVYRDVRYIVPFALQLGLFATPTIYKLDPDTSNSTTLKLLTKFNPMTSLVSSFRAAVLGEPMPWGGYAIAIAIAVFFLVAGCFYFRKTEDRFADII